MSCSSPYMSRLFPRSNSSFFLRTGNALQSKIVRLREEMYLIDAGVGRPRIAPPSELIKPPKSDGPTSFSGRVGFLTPSSSTSQTPPVKNLLLQRCFVDMVTGDPKTKQQAAARLDDMVGASEGVGGGLLLPRRFRKQRAWTELMSMWRRNAKVKGFVAEKVRGGYSVAIAGYLAFLPHRQVKGKFTGDRFIIESMSPRNFVVGYVG